MPFGQHAVRQFDVVARQPVPDLKRAFHAQEFLDGRGDEVGVVDQAAMLAGVVQKRADRVPDKRGGRLMPGVQQKDAVLDQLVLAQAHAVVFAEDKRLQHLALGGAVRVGAAAVDQVVQDRRKLGYGGIARIQPLLRDHRVERAEDRERVAAQLRPDVLGTPA